MPYNSNKDLPTWLNKYSENKRSQWRHVFNTIYKNTGDESRAFAGANSILKKRFTNRKDIEKNSHEEKFNHAINLWMKKLNG